MPNKVFSSHEEFRAQNAALNTGLPFSDDLSVLGSGLAVHGKTIPNRLACQAMEGCDGAADGRPGELTRRRYQRLAAGGAGLIWFEATAVMREGRANPRQLWITEENLDDYRRQVDEIRETALRANGRVPLIIMQATHSGRYSKPDGVPAPVIAYNNPIFEKDSPLPAGCIATDEHLDRIGAALVRGAELAEKAGFDGVDVKCCHRYINSELLSAFHREGRYGGSLENRTRLLRESVSGAMQRCSSGFIVTSRLNVYDGFPRPFGFGVPAEGTAFDPSEPEWLIRSLYDSGVRLLNVTMGNPYFNPHVNRPFAAGGYEAPEHPLEGVARMLEGTAELKRRVPGMTILCSALSYLGVSAPNVASAYIASGGFDLAGFGRTILACPDFANDILSGGLDPKKICLCCSKCTELMRGGSTPGCVLRDPVYTALYREFRKQ